MTCVVALALFFDFTNGFHDAANAIATSVSTRALTPRFALGMAAGLNFLGALLGVEVAKTIQHLIDVDSAGLASSEALWVIAAALIGAITWNYVTWWFGLPSSSSHALIGGIVGVGLAATVTVDWDRLLGRVVVPTIASPILGFFGAYLVMTIIMWMFRKARPARISRGFRWAQTLSAAAMSIGHGLQDAQKTMGVIVLALVAGGYASGDDVPMWVIAASALAISAGTYVGGWRIMRTLGRRIVDLDPPKGFAAEATAASVLYVMAIGLHAPISTTHTITSAITGAGATQRLRAVRWATAWKIVAAWLLTIPGAAVVAAGVFLIGEPLFN